VSQLAPASSRRGFAAWHPSGGSCRTVAEDEALVALSFADLLEAEGYDAILAADSEDVLMAARRSGDAFGALVTDLDMPRMRGEDLIRAVCADRPALPIVVVTGSPPRGGQEESRCRAGGHRPFLSLLKPAGSGEPASAVRRATTAQPDADSTAAAAAVPRVEPAMKLLWPGERCRRSGASAVPGWHRTSPPDPEVRRPLPARSAAAAPPRPA